MAKACWEELGTYTLVLSMSNEAERLVQWLFKIFQKANATTLENMAIVLWGIRRARNEKLWNRTIQQAGAVVSSVLHFLTEWRAVRSIEGTHERINQQNREIVSWQKPQLPTIKCNVDASLQPASRNIGIGMVLRDSAGIFISAKTNAFHGRVGIKEAEAMAFKEALNWVKILEFQEVIFESDSKAVIEAIASEREDESEFGVIISECCEVLRQRPLFRVCFVRKQANMVVHNLARVACSHARPTIWNFPPVVIYDDLNNDCNSIGSL